MLARYVEKCGVLTQDWIAEQCGNTPNLSLSVVLKLAYEQADDSVFLDLLHGLMELIDLWDAVSTAGMMAWQTGELWNLKWEQAAPILNDICDTIQVLCATRDVQDLIDPDAIRARIGFLAVELSLRPYSQAYYVERSLAAVNSTWIALHRLLQGNSRMVPYYTARAVVQAREAIKRGKDLGLFKNDPLPDILLAEVEMSGLTLA